MGRAYIIDKTETGVAERSRGDAIGKPPGNTLRHYCNYIGNLG